ncbi:ABC transporter ATP-binding protein [Rhizobium sp. Root708]|uniref:ABC transporter ATP-binding protein n=1 Tax=Rhizobium sp. Root708 TaxID=1736592 RepID=UPI0007007BCB|nr:ABC transporter ATP-binding protein [Rhizobium sp. Root708]KRB49083.1 ABC transporter ATP-binding protein [Rhizobium sp. Root708]
MSETDFILQTRELRRDFGGFRAIDGVSLDIRRGQIHAIIGPNGAGKTTTFNMLTKFLAPTAGSITLDGIDITSAGPAQVASLGMVRSFQISSTFGRLTALQNVRIALLRAANETHQFWRSSDHMNKHNDRAMQLLGQVGLETWAHHPAALLPYGRKRALELATTLALDPKILLLDEPTAGMGQEDIQTISRLVKSLAGRKTIVIVEHNLKVISELADRISVMVRGRVVCEGDYATVSANPDVKAAYLGSAHV